MHVSAIVKLASPRENEPYTHQIRACDSRNYRRVIIEITARRPFEGFTWGIYVRYNNLKYQSFVYGSFVWEIFVWFNNMR